MTGPLQGVRILDLTENVLGPLATQVLGDAGAEVIKVEPPRGDPMRNVGPSRTDGMGALFLNLNRNKKSVVLDLKNPEDHATLLRLVPGADVFVHCMRPAAARRLGIDYRSVQALNPRLIYASASGFRRATSLADTPAYDDVIQGRSGLAALNLDAAGDPRYLPTVLADKLSGLCLASAIGMALFHRERTDQGQEVHLPMLDTITAFTLVEHLWGATLDGDASRTGYPRVLSPDRRPFRTRDGHICVLAITDRQWQRFFRAIGRDDLGRDPRFGSLSARTANIDLLYAEVGRTLAGRTTREWRQTLDAADLPNGPVNTLAELLADPYFVESGLYTELDHPSEGRLTTIIPTIDFSETPQEIAALAPTLGDHTQAVLHEIKPTAARD